MYVKGPFGVYGLFTTRFNNFLLEGWEIEKEFVSLMCVRKRKGIPKRSDEKKQCSKEIKNSLITRECVRVRGLVQHV